MLCSCRRNRPTIFMASVKSGSIDDPQAASDHKETYSRANEVPTIFLSHSGKQKAFVENLYDALLNANHIAFFDKHSLPKGSRFPELIKRAARGCKLGVVVLSNDFLTSKWPMLELEMLVLERGPGAFVLPLFYQMSPEDLKPSDEKLTEWRCLWKEMAGQHANQWERAVKDLRSFNGVLFTPGTSEVAYIKRVVSVICNLVKSPLPYDISPIQGHQRFAKEVASQFQEAARQSDKVCSMVGLYGIGGLGKTSMCKVMCNFYTSQYPGKSHLIEFPSDGDEKKIVQECTKALKKLANLSDEHLLNKIDSFDQVVQLMREKLRQYDLFLAVDNVWESSLEVAKRMLRNVSFSSNSKILLTSRSEEVLKDLVRGHSNTSVRPLPSPDQEEAFQLFQDTFELGDINSLVNRNLLHRVLKRCFFSDNYHPLALKAVAKHVKRVCLLEGLDKIEHNLSNILEGISNRRILQNVDDLIQLNYVNLAVGKKHIFLDIVVVVMAAASTYDFQVTYGEAQQWLNILYKEQYSKSTIANLIYELALDGLIQLENIDDTSAKKVIRVHDLYSDLAQREAASSAKFFTDGSTRSVKEIKWERLERVILRDRRVILRDRACFIAELQQQECRNLQVLSAENIDLRSGINLNLMPSLCVLKLKSGNLRSIKNWSAATGLAIVNLVNLHCTPPLKPIPNIPCLESLIIQNVKTVQGPLNFDGCQHLKKLSLAEASVFKDWKASYFSSLTNLESLQIEHFNSITRVLNLNALVNLQLLSILRCESVERIEGLDALKNLQSLDVEECLNLGKLDGLSGLACLEKLVLVDNKSMEEVVGGLSPALKEVRVGDCEALKRMPDLRGLTCLEKLVLVDNKSMEEVVGGLSPALKEVKVWSCEALKRMPDLRGLTCLEKLVLREVDNKSMELEVVGGLSPALKEVHFGRCEALKRMPDLRGLTCLEKLVLYDNNSIMEEVVGAALKEVIVCNNKSMY